jgi:hypothetical protein
MTLACVRVVSKMKHLALAKSRMDILIKKAGLALHQIEDLIHKNVIFQ